MGTIDTSYGSGIVLQDSFDFALLEAMRQRLLKCLGLRSESTALDSTCIKLAGCDNIA